tara:strand:+ start:32786 stop:34381 length:1596 start_codon:yes stop_codon:yes gene_type:complete
MDNRLNRFAKGISTQNKLKTQAVIYTRVSTKEQAESNASLETQLKYCLKYAEEHGLEVIDCFGGTYESAKDDERKEFQKMLSFVRKNDKIGFVIVYSFDRFSRSGPSGAFISYELKRKGIQLVSATQNIDHSDPSGDFMEGIYHLFSQFDNQLRRDKSVTGMKEALKKGYWPYVPPTGYKNLNEGQSVDKHEFVITKRGKLLKKAFEWKAKQNLTLVEIAKRLKSRGWDIPPKRLTHFFQNPFYCGMIASKLLPGELVEGKHPALISRATFLQVHENLSKYNSGYIIQQENDQLPLKSFLKCDACGTPFTGYMVRKKGLYYYKCNKKGCKNNRSQKFLHERFKALLDKFTLDERLIPVFKEMLTELIDQTRAKKPKQTKSLKQEISQLEKKVETIEERFALGEIEKSIYLKYKNNYKSKINELSLEMDQVNKSLSNSQKAMKNAVSLVSKLSKIWENGDFQTKVQLQRLLFPDGISYDREKDDYRTTRVNLLFRCIPIIMQDREGQKNGEATKNRDIPTLVVPPGLEPGTF